MKTVRLPDWLRTQLRQMRVVTRAARWMEARHVGRISVGVGTGLRFRSGPSNPSYAIGDNELAVQEVLARFLRPGDVFYDVGANVGFFSVIAARLVGPHGAVCAFEPVPGNAALVRQNAEMNGFRQVEVVPYAVAGQSGTAELSLAAYSGGAVLSEIDTPPDATGERLSVVTVRLDDWIFGQGHRTPRLVKIDVEGAEADVLAGMERTLAEHQPVVTYEVDAPSRERLEEKDRACRTLLADAGYDVRPLPEAYADSGWSVRNVLAVPARRR